MTIRATRVVLDHFNREQLPPDPFPLKDLTLKAQRPTAADLHELRQWQHLVKCIEDICLRNFEWALDCARTVRNDPESWPNWQGNFHRAIYRFFLMGAVLCRAYQEPLTPTAKHNGFPPSLKYLGTRIREPDDKPLLMPLEMTHLLKQHPVFDFEAFHKHEPIYGPLAELIKEQTERRARDSGLEPSDLLLKKMVDCLIFSVSLFDPVFQTSLWTFAIRRFRKEITVIPLGQFYPETIRMPSKSRNAHRTLLRHAPVVSPRNGSDTSAWGLPSLLLDRILTATHSFSEQPNHWEAYPGARRHPTPPPPMQVFQYILRKYLVIDLQAEHFKTTSCA
ncbi:hypothetical protein BDW74DRAFT_181223 [Aspergillus multicolor]|uniref:uncharacterized protein n=1 Tax=Aspergillus multicolor TaxID=41759 RepID=UPI003CCDCABE